MTIDERLNSLEDTINKLKEALNYNNSIARAIHKKNEERIHFLESQVNMLVKTKTAPDFGDIFKGMKK